VEEKNHLLACVALFHCFHLIKVEAVKKESVWGKDPQTGDWCFSTTTWPRVSPRIIICLPPANGAELS
jgi:hypothetical protein